MENKQKIQELLQDEGFVIRILESQTPQDIQAEFKDNGVDISLEEAQQIVKDFESIEHMVSDEGLENVSGGSFTEKFCDKLGEGAANMVWLIPTVAVTAATHWYVKQH